MEYELKVLKINDNKIKQLNELSLYTVKDLILHYPYRYEEMLETPLHDETKVIIEFSMIFHSIYQFEKKDLISFLKEDFHDLHFILIIMEKL